MLGENKKLIARFFAQAGVIIFIGYLLSEILGLGSRLFAEENILSVKNFYISGAVYLMGIVFLFIYEVIIKQDDKKYGSGVGFASQGELPSLSIFKKTSPLQIFLISLILFSFLGLFVAVKGQTFTGLQVLPQQFTPVDSILYSSLLIPIAENLGAGFLIAICIFSLRLLARKYDLGKINFIIICFTLIPIIIGIYGIIVHQLVYSGKDVAGIVVFMFWSLGSLFTLLTGSFLPFWLMHTSNNFFIDISRFLSSETLVGLIFLSIVAVSILYYALYGFRLTKKES